MTKKSEKGYQTTIPHLLSWKIDATVIGYFVILR